MRGIVIRGIFIILSLFFFSIPAYADWQKIAPGWYYQKTDGVYLFRVDPKKIRTDVVTAKQFGMKTASAQTLATKSGASFVINGSFFDENYESLGLLISSGKELQPVRPISWWAIFWVDENGAHITHHTNFEMKPAIQAALQVGPRSLIQGEVPKLKEGPSHRRSGICTTVDNQLVVFETGKVQMTPHEFASFMKSEKLGCVNGLSLDGGASSQLYAKHGDFVLLLEGQTPVANGLAFFSKN